jgi:FKBP-type peptidyl-prolyl cis-trans isomerase FkpA
MSVTTVPIQPIKKGSVAKYWIGMATVVLVGGALAWWGTASIRQDYATDEQFLANNASVSGVTVSKSGLQMQTIKAGEGPSPTDDDVALISYKGTLRDGTVFDQNPQAPMEVSRMIPGFSEALKKMQRGGKYMVWIPGQLGYGENPPANPQTGKPAFKPNETLIFEVEMMEFRSRAELEAAQQKAEAAERAGNPKGPPPSSASELPPEIQAQIEAQMRQQQGQ